MGMVRARVLTALMLALTISLIIMVLATTGQQPTLYRYWTYSPIKGVSEEYLVYKVTANGINYSRIVINIESINGKPLSNASVTVFALTPYHIVPVRVYAGSRVVIPMDTPSIAYAVDRWVSWMLRSTWHSIQPGLYTALLVFITYQTPRGVYIKSFTIPYAPAPLYIGNESYVIIINAKINTTAPPDIPISQLKPAGPAVAKPLLELSNNTDQPGQLYDCMSQSPEAPVYAPGTIPTAYGYLALANCTGYNGTIPLLWVSWSQNVFNELSQSNAQLYGEIYIQSSSNNQPFSLYGEELKSSNGQVIAYVAGITFTPQSFDIGSPYLQWLGTFGTTFTGPGIYYLGVPGAYGMAQYQYWTCNPYFGTCTPTNQYYYYVVGLNVQSRLINGIDTGNGPVTAIFRFLNYYGLSLPTPKYVGCSVNNGGVPYFYFPNGTSETALPYLIAEYVANVFNVPLLQVMSALVSALEGGVIVETIVETGGLPTWAQWVINVLSDMGQLTNLQTYKTSYQLYYAVEVQLSPGQYIYYNVVPGISYVNYNGQTYAVPTPGVELNETWAGGQLAQGCPPTYLG
ncbi:hypothetical protein [Vulcanisaeta distributa]|uniref:Uncharacterized protein n=1 Tax=Vulcanisaeta distributa (strain DSM 14429 / JCM 11212 / NBRC 100878 / IC-017) TaxID=572478 RepID=E1QUQ5_VULDI|nr:hypothetical protein [Vulcanisaeta distributa]ADN51174.1 hypothetical protein Vdis_1800 [Vulcanisaeta distributa DSM 14429]